MSGLERSDRVVTCTIIQSEVLFGKARLPEGKRRAELEATGRKFFNVLRTGPEQAGDIYAAIKVARRQRAFALDENGLWVATTALALGATLVGRDADFTGFDGLSVVALRYIAASISATGTTCSSAWLPGSRLSSQNAFRKFV